MVNQVIHINKKKYAVGLLWQPVGSGFSGRSYARSLSKNIDKKLNLYTEARAMVGLGSYSFGHRLNMPVAAAEVMNGLSEYSSFLASFVVDNGFYMVAARNGVILQDRFFIDEAEARQEYAKLAQLPDWGTFIAPEEWAMPRAIERDIAKVVSITPRIMLHAISRFRTALWPIIVLLIFVIILLGFFREPIKQMGKNKTTTINPELAAEYKKRIEEKNKELDAQYEIVKKEIQPIVLPYDNLPNTKERAELCYKAVAFLMQPVAGWNQTSVECNDKYAIAQIKRKFGTLGDFYLLAADAMPHSFVQERDEDNVVVTAVLPKLETYASIDERDVESVVRDVTTLFQMLNVPVEINTVVDTITNGVDSVNVNVVEIQAQSKLMPVNFMEIFDTFDGVYMTRCVWNMTNRIWNYEVIIYAK